MRPCPFFSDCQLQQVQMTIYSRWGQQLFHTNGATAAWDGITQQQAAPEGIYLVYVEYIWLDNVGNAQQRSFLQEVTLYR